MIPAYTPELTAELARRNALRLPEARLKGVADTLTHVHRFIATLQTIDLDQSVRTKETSSDETA